MRKLFLASMIFVALSSVAGAAQETTVRWHRTVPETVAFAVLMPEVPVRVRRAIPFSEGLMIVVPVHEIAHRGVLFSVLSFDRRKTNGLPKTFDNFVKGLRYAMQHSSRATDSEFTFEREVARDKQTARQYLVRAEGKKGTAQVYETPTHYYVLMTLGAQASDLLADNFFNSFTLDARSALAASDKVSIKQDFSPSPRAPEPLWPVAGLKSEVGAVYGTIGPVGTDTSKASAPRGVVIPRMPDTTSDGVLNGKLISKPQPKYPPIAIAARAQGVVVVQVTVDEEGYTISAQAVSGHPLLQQAAVHAARQVRFAPTLLKGKPVKVAGVITYNFVLE